jgi:hypothetical protein
MRNRLEKGKNEIKCRYKILAQAVTIDSKTLVALLMDSSDLAQILI